MASLYIIPWVFFGFLYCQITYRVKFELHRFSTQYLLYFILLNGTQFIVFGFLSVMFIYLGFRLVDSPLGFVDAIKSKNIHDNFYTFIFVAIFGFIATTLKSWHINFKDTKAVRNRIKKISMPKEQRKHIIESYVYQQSIKNDPIKTKIALNFFYNLSTKKQPSYLMFDIGKDKVYVGVVTKIGMPSDHHLPDSVAITPLLSGYRNEEKRVVFTTDYQGQEFSETIFKESDIVCVKDFREDTFKAFQEPKHKIRKPLRANFKRNNQPSRAN